MHGCIQGEALSDFFLMLIIYLIRHHEKYSLLLKFDGSRVPSKKFFSPTGFHGWDYLNSQYQGRFLLKLD